LKPARRFALDVIAVFSVAVSAANAQISDRVIVDRGWADAWSKIGSGPLPRWSEEGTPFDPEQPLIPYAVRLDGIAGMGDGVIDSPPEYSPSKGVLFRYSSSDFSTTVRDCVAALTGDPNTDEIAYVVVASASQQTAAVVAFSAAGADMNRVNFILQPNNSVWLRDYGPHFVWQNGARGIVDSHYYPTRPLDNFTPTLLAQDYFHEPVHAIGLYYSGGNFQPGPNRSGFCTALVSAGNPEMSLNFIAGLYQRFQGIDTLHVLPQFPSSVDSTGHIDMWMYIVDEHNCVITQFIPGSNGTAVQITENAVPYMQNLGFTVQRVPAFQAIHPSFPGSLTHFTYANAFRVNNRIFIPTYGAGNSAYLTYDNQALAAWQTAAGAGVQIVPINCYPIIWAAGAIHCIVMQVPAHAASIPSADVIWPDGGELVAAGSTQTIQWSASDDVAITSVDAYYSLDGMNWLLIGSGPHTGSRSWNVPVVATTSARVKVVAHDADGNSVEALSARSFQIAPTTRTLYDFNSSPGVNNIAVGYQSSAWSVLNGTRRPSAVATTLTAASYARMAASDAVGTITDLNRYVTPAISSGYEATMIFEFSVNEDPATIDDISIVWEGFAEGCAQVELYIWDNALANWSDGAGTGGENVYMENYAGNRDEVLRAAIRGNFSRYVVDGKLTLLLYTERSGNRSAHDYIGVTVSVIRNLLGDMNCDAIVNNFDIDPFEIAITDPAGYALAYPGCDISAADTNGDHVVNNFDIDPFVNLLTNP
jgi:agmatine deiminase